MNKFLQTFILVVSIILMIGCTINNSNNINQKKEDKIIKEIKNVDSNLEHNLPLGIDSVKLMSSGKVILLTNDELIPNEEVTVSLDVKKIYIFPFGNGGYRSVLFLKNDGTISALSAKALIEDKRIEVLDNIGGYTNVVDLEQQKDSSASYINVVLESGEKKLLDEYIE